MLSFRCSGNASSGTTRSPSTGQSSGAHKEALVQGCPLADQAQRQLDLSLSLLLATRQTTSGKPRPRIAARKRAFAQARNYIDAYAGEELTSADLCTAASVAQRTLEYAFHDCSGLSPKAYLKAVRLNRTRATLRGAEPGSRVADAANQWGFWHMGQFARDYKCLFGVRPKDDLMAGL
jgi:AraC family ethanolamine operon transcriptional activator